MLTIEQIAEDLSLAKRWLSSHFPTEGSDTLLDAHRFNHHWIDDVTVEIEPRMYGAGLGRYFQYKFCYWKGYPGWEITNLLAGSKKFIPTGVRRDVGKTGA